MMMTMKTQASRVVALAVVLALPLCAAGSSSARPTVERTGPAKAQPCKKAKKKRCASKLRQTDGPALSSVPAEQVEAFEVLAGPALSSVPAIVSRSVANGGDRERFGLDPAQTRSMTVGREVIYVVPGSRGLCIEVPTGIGACASTAAAVAGQLSVISIPAAPGRAKETGSGVGPGPVTWYGLAPDGVATIVGLTVSGVSVAATQSGNGYVIKADEPIASATLGRPGQSPLTVG